MRRALSGIIRLYWLTAYQVYLYLRGRDRVVQNLNAWGFRCGIDRVLRSLGAAIGPDTRIDLDLRIKNAENGCCENLTIGRHVRTCPGMIIDLADRVTIEDEAVLSDATIIVTHFSVGDRPLQKIMKPVKGPVHVGRGAYVGVGSIILHGVTIGDYAIVGAGTLVRRDVPPRSTVVGVPGRVVKTFEIDPDS